MKKKYNIIKYRILDLVPAWFRTRWPLRKFFWQTEEIEAAFKRAEEICDKIKWD